jgi:hypothetical protein
VKFSLWLLTASLAFGAAGPPLPAWDAEDRKALKKGEIVPGLLLLTEETTPQPAAPEVPTPTPEEMADPGKTATEVAEKYLDAYFGARPAHFLVDPQGLLGTKENRDRENFLKYHSSDSQIDLFVYLFDGPQEIPSEVRKEEVAERLFSDGKPAVLVFYFLGAPLKSEIQVSPSLSEAVSAADERRALSSSVEEAMEKPDKNSQFEAFCVQLAIRIYWMERAAGLVREESAQPVTRPLVKEAEHHTLSPAMTAKIQEAASRWGVPAGIMAGAILTVFGGLWIARRRVRYRFPAFDVPPRLGGAHAAGVGAVISFGSTTQSPSSQRNDVPDYLGL